MRSGGSGPNKPLIVLISFRSRSGADHPLEFLAWCLSVLFYRRASRFIEFQTKVAHTCFCFVRIKMPLFMCCFARSPVRFCEFSFTDLICPGN